ncbi:MAG: regulatory protein RecX, partial [Vicinamibacteria bacterium]
ELSAKLARAGYTAVETLATVARIEEKVVLDDYAVAREIARASSERKLWGPARIENKLRVLRVGKEDIAGAIEEAFPEGEEEAAARALQKFRKRAPGGGAPARARAYRHLLGRGFSPDVAHRLVSTSDFGDTGRS